MGIDLPTDEMMQAGYEAMFDDKYDGTQAPMMNACWDAMIAASGMVLVPMEATQAMLDAAYYPAAQRRGAKSVWQVMVAAAKK